MPFDSSGNYVLPSVYLATNGEDATAAQHNTPLEDLAAGMNGLLLRSGVAAMTGAFKGYVGTEAAPGIAFNGSSSLGFYKTSNGWGWSYNGAKVIEFGAGGIIQGATPIGSGMDYWGTTAPAGWLFAYGQVLSQTTYAALYAVLGSTYNTGGEGTGNFRMPDKRDRASFGKSNMGGTSANRITDQTDGWNGDVLGDAGGLETSTIGQTHLPAIKPAITIIDPGHAHNVAFKQGVTGGGSAEELQASPSDGAYATASSTTGISAAFTNNLGSGTALNNLPPGIVCNYIIFAGA